MTGRKSTKVLLTCQVCGNKFYRKPSEIARGVSKCCSRKCNSLLQVGHIVSDEVRRAISEKAKERFKNKPHHMKGIPRSEETKQKIAARLMGNKNGANWSEERKTRFHAKMAGVNGPLYGKKKSEEERRHISEGHKGVQAKERHPNWRGGISFEPYCPAFNKELKEEIRKKFNRKCFLCPTIENKERHSIHHIDYNKNSLCNGKKWPLLPLCRKCHMRTNYNRWYWFNLLIYYWGMNPDINFGVADVVYLTYMVRARSARNTVS